MSTSFSFELKSHYHDSEYKLLYEHLKNVGRVARKIVSDKTIKDKELFMDIAYLIGISHDFAKSTTFFQNHLKIENEKTEKAYHGKLSSIFGYYLVKKYLESENNLKDANRFLPAIAWLVILKHHSDINNLMGTMGELEKLNDLEVEKEQMNDIRNNYFHELKVVYEMLKPSTFEINLEEFFDKFDEICERIKEEGEELAMKQKIENYFMILFFYSALLDADKLDASNIDFEKIKKERMKWQNLPEDLVDKYKRVKFIEESELNSIRNECYHEVISNLMRIKDNLDKERIFSIELPTGFGKTLTAFSFALKLKRIVKDKLGFSPKIIYSLPFLSIIDQNAKVISEVLEEYVGLVPQKESHSESGEEKKVPTTLLLKHHHLSDIFYKTSENELIEEPEKSLLLIEGWHSEIVVTTFVQFFHSLITNKNKAARKFHNIVNSIIILDEVQSIPYKYWSLIRESLKHLALNYNCWIILMTATQPLIFRENEVVPLVKNKKKYFGRFNRVKYFVEIKEKDFDEFKYEIFNEIIKTREDFAIIVNTVPASKELYDFLRGEFKKVYNELRVTEEGILEFRDVLLIDLSTHILPVHRVERIRKIREFKGKRKVIVTTQLIEAGVDISVGIIYRDFAPVDCIIQSGGRCNRNNEGKKGICKIIYLKHKDGHFCRIYDNTLLNTTREILSKKDVFEERDINSLIQEYFEKILERGSDEESEDSIKAMEKLNFTEVGEFELIEDEKAKIDVFVDINKKSSEIWHRYNEIMSIKKGFERRNRFLGIRSKFYNYVIQVYRKDAEKYCYSVQPYLYYSQKEKYDIEIGFKGGETEGAYLIW